MNKMKEIKYSKNEKWEHYYFGLLETKENEKTINYYTKKLINLFKNGESYPKAIDFLDKSKYKLNLEEREGNNLQFVKINGKYYDQLSGSGVSNSKLKQILDLKIYEEVNLDLSRELAIKNLTAIVQGDLSLGDKKIIKDIAIQNLFSNFEKAINLDCNEIWHWVSCVRLDLHDWPRTQLLQYGFQIKHHPPWIQDINLENR